MGKEYYYNLINQYNAEIESNNNKIREKEDKLSNYNSVYNATCEYAQGFSEQQGAQKLSLTNMLNDMIGRGRYSNNILNGIGSKMETVINESGASSLSALSEAEGSIQESIRLIKEEISDLEDENTQYNSNISYCRQEIKRIEAEEAAEKAKKEMLDKGGVV